MDYNIFTLNPDIFTSFFGNSLIARGVAQDVISYELINWRDEFGIGSYNQVDDKPFGGGSGMVLMPEPIMQAMESKRVVSSFYDQGLDGLFPNNSRFEDAVKSGELNTKNVTVSLTPRGFPLNQQVVEWLANDFDHVSILCGRYEGFDARVSEGVDLELSMGNYVLNGGEVAAMSLVEAVSRLVPGFVTKETSVLHDSFSSELNRYSEQGEYVVGKRRVEQGVEYMKAKSESKKLFNNDWYEQNVLPHIEHPQYTRPSEWRGRQVPEVLLGGDHKRIDEWRTKGWRG